MLLPLSLVALCLSTQAAARTQLALAEDLFAFPKFRVTFLNGLPLLNATAERWLRDGLKGGELEFLERPWQTAPGQFKEIAGTEASDVSRIYLDTSVSNALKILARDRLQRACELSVFRSA